MNLHIRIPEVFLVICGACIWSISAELTDDGSIRRMAAKSFIWWTPWMDTGLLITVGDFGLNHTSTEIKNFLWSNIISPKDNFFLIIACFFLILGLILKIIYYFIAKHYFCSWDGIKVTFF